MKITFLLVLLATALQLSAGQPDSRITVFASASWGQSYEHVYQNSVSNVLLSELIWDINTLVFAGVEKKRFISDSVHLSLSLSARAGSLWGEMTDTDWKWWPSETDWTHYSRSDTLLIAAFSSDLRASFLRTGPLWFHGGLRLDYLEWEDRAQEGIYSSEHPSSEFRTIEKDFKGVRAIDYLQVFFVPYAGVSFLISGDDQSLRSGAYITPFAVSAARDYHRLRGLRFLDWSIFSFYVSLESEYSRKLFGDVYLVLGFQALHIPSSRGSTLTYREGSPFSLSRNTSGIGTWSIQPRMGLSFSVPD